ncbi:MAG TPA: chromosome segregation protein SMC [Fimbriimonas sp.]|nr:chromosome segregation protein SMC [Fimbriimonas sp.]
MRLKSVRIFGFKTFADRTEFNLDGSVIAVVGPNGCGKSNLVDAILWGLGEGNARQLRAQSGQDVIFNGSAKRRGVGYAEVTLLFDNEDGSLPLDMPEVAITRRVTRGGDNEYSINRRSCRQRDVYELLADSGLGRAGYAIVGQKDIDNALNASAEDRRGWIDEAAGVQRYRQRKAESLRRLSSAQDHLSRVTSILEELESQREPLREEAEQAARYRSLQKTLTEVEIGYLAAEAATALAEQTTLEARITENVRLAESESVRAENLEATVSELGGRARAMETLTEQRRLEKQEIQVAAAKTEADIRLSLQRLESLSEQEKTLLLDREETAARIREAQSETDRLEAESLEEQEKVEAVRTATAGFGEEAAKLSQALDEAESQLVEARHRETQRLKKLADRAHRLERQNLASRELRGIEAGFEDLHKALNEARASVEEINATLLEREAGIQLSADESRQLKEQEERDSREVRSALAERAAFEGRRRGIEATIDAHEGIAAGPRAVLEAAERGLLVARYVPVAQAIEVKKEYAVAIETALGGAANDLIVEQESDAKAAIAFLKEHRAGRATFQPIPLMRPVNTSQDLRRLLNERGVVGTASSLVQCEDRFRPVVESLMGRVVVVDGLDVALGLARTAGWSRIVTLEGEVVHSSGAVTGGQQGRQGYGMVQRKADLAEIDRELSKLAGKIGGFEKRSSARQKQITLVDEQVAVLRAGSRQVEHDLGEAKSFLRTLEDELKSAQREKERLQKELSQPLEEVAEAPEDLAERQRQRDEAIKVLAAKSADAEQAKARLIEAEARLAQAKARHESSRRRLEAARHADATREKRAESIGPERNRIEAQLADLETRLLSEREQERLAESGLQKLIEDRRQVIEQMGRVGEEAQSVRENVAALGAAMHQAELARTRADARRSTALARLAEEYGLTAEDVAQRPEAVPPADAPQIVSRLRREMRAMGDVNLGAIEAYDRLTVRYDELFSQREDVASGIIEIEKSVKELDKLTRDRFADTFEKVQHSFERMFVKLFGGGEGRISLTDSSDVLNSGIEIEVTLPGKRKQALSLLSGGERSLCTTAFLMALLDVKPSPLVVLDEVDAPLDGRNVERFAQTLKEFTDRSQFILITHNPVTIESAPVWVGVTMQEPGVSTLLPARVPSRDPASRQLIGLN